MLNTLCSHVVTLTETRHQTTCRYIPKGWDDRNDDDPYETVTVEDIDIICATCGELLETIVGD